VPRRVEERQEADELPRAAGAVLALLRHVLTSQATIMLCSTRKERKKKLRYLSGNRERPEPALGVLVDDGVHPVPHVLPALAQLQDLLRRTLAGAVPASARDVDVSERGALIHGVERQEMHLLHALPCLLGVGEHAHHGGIDGVLVLHPRRPCREQDHLAGVHALGEDLDEASVHAELVERERAGLVAAQHVHACHLLDGGHALGDGALQRQPVGPDGHGDRQHGGHGDGDAADEEHEEVVDAVAVPAVLDQVHDDDLDEDADGDGGDAEVADGPEHLLEVAHLVGAVHQVRRLAEEGVHAGGDHHRLDLPLLARGPGVHAVPRGLGHRQRLPGERRLVDLEGVAVEEARVGGDDVSELDADDVAGDENRRFLLAPPPVAEDLRLGRQVRHQRLGGAAGAALLPVGDGGVDEEKRHDAHEVLPVRRLPAAVGETDGHQRRHLHHPRQRVPHEPQELENLALLQHSKNSTCYTPYSSSYRNCDVTFFSSSLLGPKTTMRALASSEERPSLVHLRL
jgi:hypothetical protein